MPSVAPASLHYYFHMAGIKERQAEKLKLVHLCQNKFHTVHTYEQRRRHTKTVYYQWYTNSVICPIFCVRVCFFYRYRRVPR